MGAPHKYLFTGEWGAHRRVGTHVFRGGGLEAQLRRLIDLLKEGEGVRREGEEVFSEGAGGIEAQALGRIGISVCVCICTYMFVYLLCLCLSLCLCVCVYVYVCVCVCVCVTMFKLFNVTLLFVFKFALYPCLFCSLCYTLVCFPVYLTALFLL